MFANNDLFFVESDMQHIIDTMNAFPGWWKENPLDGVGIMAYTKSSTDLQELNRKVKIELISDGYKSTAPVVTLINGQLTINPNAQIL